MQPLHIFEHGGEFQLNDAARADGQFLKPGKKLAKEPRHFSSPGIEMPRIPLTRF
jgi:hypothetical protein